MMGDNLWSEAEADSYISQFRDDGEDLALRVYTSRLLGRQTSLVLHGGGNTSVKLRAKTFLGDEVDVVAVKGSGWNLDSIAPRGFPMVHLDHCRRMLQVEKLSDEQMYANSPSRVNELRTHMLDCSSPTPSVETLLHAFLPHKYVDHTHADAILALVDQPEDIARKMIKDVFGDSFGVVPYVMPGFDLARKVAEVYTANPSVKGLLLLKHGIFTFAETARESYELHVEAVHKAETFVARHLRPAFAPTHAGILQCCDSDRPSPASQSAAIYSTLALLLRSCLREISGDHWLVHRRVSESIMSFVNSEDAHKLSQRGPLTPDHVIRTKGWPMVLDGIEPHCKTLHAGVHAEQQAMQQAREWLLDQVRMFMGKYDDYFERQNARYRSETGRDKIKLDSLPRVILVPGVGVVTVGLTYIYAVIASDIYEHTVATSVNAMSVGDYEPVNERDLFDMEYWSLEQAKLKVNKTPSSSLQGKVAIVSGAASGIGLVSAQTLARNGACVVILDKDADGLAKARATIQGECLALITDMVKESSVRAAVMDAVQKYGGIDIVLSNAGAAFQSNMAQCETDHLRQSIDLNFLSHQYLVSACVSIMRRQKTGGAVLFNVSKAVMNPGENFGPYTTAKAALLALMKQYALEEARHGITSNAVNADRVRTAIFSDEVIKQRAQARGLTTAQYFQSNLLQREVTSQDVADAFLYLATAKSTTAAIITVDGGNISASIERGCDPWLSIKAFDITGLNKPKSKRKIGGRSKLSKVQSNNEADEVVGSAAQKRSGAENQEEPKQKRSKADKQKQAAETEKEEVDKDEGKKGTKGPKSRHEDQAEGHMVLGIHVENS